MIEDLCRLAFHCNKTDDLLKPSIIITSIYKRETMYSEHITFVCGALPINNTERFLYYPALAVYSPIQDSVITIVGGIFTALSLATLGLCKPINRVADWTEHSQRILTVPAQIFGNMFEIRSETLINFNFVRSIHPYLGVTFYAYKTCRELFNKNTETMIQSLGRHIIFRASCVMNAISGVAIKCILVPMVSFVITPLALYHCGREAKYNQLALEILKCPQCIHKLCLSLRMIVNPLQFTRSKQKIMELDNKPYWHALIAPGLFWGEN